MKHAVFLIATLLLSACQSTYTVELFDGPQREDELVATIVPVRGCLHCMRWIRPAGTQTNIYTYPTRKDPFDTPAVPGKFRVPPGRYVMSIAENYGKGPGSHWIHEVDLEPGHTYRLDYDKCFFFCGGVRLLTYVWMEEVFTNDVLIGIRPP